MYDRKICISSEIEVANLWKKIQEDKSVRINRFANKYDQMKNWFTVTLRFSRKWKVLRHFIRTGKNKSWSKAFCIETSSKSVCCLSLYRKLTVQLLELILHLFELILVNFQYYHLVLECTRISQAIKSIT